ncbi:MAG: bifunctional methylenetetrahydrofolate dehydrogenase/methenyltetrahydrofolate cyclohydrolase FolD [Micavibrio aeruginosavorus]|uniref:Bifunctional protein FolD n=1 Tax=Micavibrio aeruginosavorus TaxID=349221 RepID=A0A7T5R1U1_9BACT|nr:MAG: bifunctional methylenetetrahydrofolate dehydrogenase/methenyltetrahydrofolate cyclohydrolase FolD [Micavibrio aeruginosavorus]
MAVIIDGKAAAERLKTRIAGEVAALRQQGRAVGLAVILVGDDPASHIYVRNKIAACEKTGITSTERRLPAAVGTDELKRVIEDLNRDPAIHGILLQLPLPGHLDENEMILAISPDKDVDGLHPVNAGRLMAGLPGMVPCTPQGSLMLIQDVRPDLRGLHAVVIGRSLLFGKPMAQLLLGADCTVTQCHSKTRDLPAFCRQADILVAAVGRPQMVKADWVKPGATVIDVGINRIAEKKVVGDVDFESVSAVAGAITPVPGGVGPMTIACLLANTLKAAKSD